MKWGCRQYVGIKVKRAMYNELFFCMFPFCNCNLGTPRKRSFNLHMAAIIKSFDILTVTRQKNMLSCVIVRFLCVTLPSNGQGIKCSPVYPSLRFVVFLTFFFCCLLFSFPRRMSELIVMTLMLVVVSHFKEKSTFSAKF